MALTRPQQQWCERYLRYALGIARRIWNDPEAFSAAQAALCASALKFDHARGTDPRDYIGQSVRRAIYRVIRQRMQTCPSFDDLADHETQEPMSHVLPPDLAGVAE